jgi:hypothetical protein
MNQKFGSSLVGDSGREGLKAEVQMVVRVAVI